MFGFLASFCSALTSASATNFDRMLKRRQSIEEHDKRRMIVGDGGSPAVDASPSSSIDEFVKQPWVKSMKEAVENSTNAPKKL